MEQKWELIISKTLGIEPLRINSSLVSAQQRQRLYWTNIGTVKDGFFGYDKPGIPQPKDKKIFLRDILETEVDEKYYISETMMDRIKRLNTGDRMIDSTNKAMCFKATYYKQGRDNQLVNENDFSFSKIDVNGYPKSNQDKASCFTAGAHSGGNHSDMGLLYTKQIRQLNPSTESGGALPYQQNRIYDTNGITPALCSNKADLLVNTERIRRLTPTEAERLQTIPDGFTSAVSDSQRYKMIGNGFTIDVIAHIIKYIS
jgi:DNA (cytosine-5)-methyltransferase 3A